MITAKTAAVIIIGNEILSGRTQDANLSYIAQTLVSLGIKLVRAIVIPDVEQTIVDTVRHYANDYDYVFTTGGIGPTHDDITTASVAKAFNKKLIRHPVAVAAMERYYEPGQLADARLKMADIPEDADLLLNPVSGAPGFQLENVFVLAGVPEIMRAMFDLLSHELIGGPPILTASISTNLGESQLAEGLGKIQAQDTSIDIGSYPYFRKGKFGVNLVLCGLDANALNSLLDRVKQLIIDCGGILQDESRAA